MRPTLRVAVTVCADWSFLPALVAFSLILILQLLHDCLRKYKKEGAMPLASTCSAAISAACHRPDADREAHLLPVQWGVVNQDELGRECCSFTTSRTVVPPTLGMDCLGMAPKADASRKRWFPRSNAVSRMGKGVAWKEPNSIWRRLVRSDRNRHLSAGSLKDA